MKQVLASLGQQNAVVPAARCRRRTTWCRCAWRRFDSVDALRAMPIRAANGTQLRLGDIADIRRGYVDPPQVLVRHNGAGQHRLGISMAKGGDIIALGKALRSAVADIRARCRPAWSWCRCRTSRRRVAARSTNS
jgi:multidrug efflux pump